jgi:hypothetical protein
MAPTQCTIHLVSANLGRQLGPHIPETVVKTARGALGRGVPAKRLRGAWVMAFGDDLHFHLVTCNQDFSGWACAGRRAGSIPGSSAASSWRPPSTSGS